MSLSLFISQIELLFIASISVLIAIEFYKSKNGRLRILMIRLFCSKVWLYGGAFIIYFIYPKMDLAIMRTALLTPMFVIMVQLWAYIRNTHKK